MAAIQERETLNEITSEHDVQPTVSAWKREAIEGLSAFFAGGVRVDGRELKRQDSELFEQIGRLKVRGFALQQRRQLIGRSPNSASRSMAGHWGLLLLVQRAAAPQQP